MKKVYDDLRHQIETGPYPGREHIVDFVYMDGLRNEMADLFAKESLPLSLFEKDKWVPFIAALVQVLVDQPIVNPIPEVPRLVLTPYNPGCICGIMEFSDPITAQDEERYDHYDFENTY